MRLLNWPGLLALIPAAAAITILYMLRLRRRDVVVPSTLLWRDVVRDVRPNAPIQKLRRTPLFWLQILGAVALAVALAKPVFSRQVEGGRSTVLVVDTTASMAATDVGGGRLAEAKRIAHRLIDSMKPGDQMLVIDAGTQPKVRNGYTADRGRLHRVVDGLLLTQSAGQLRDALTLAGSLVGAKQQGRVEVISDFAGPPLSGLNLGAARVTSHSVGTGSRNVGITSIDVRPTETGLAVAVVLKNADSQATSVMMDVTTGDKLLDSREVGIAAKAEATEMVDLSDITQPTPVTVTLQSDDMLLADNSAFVVVRPNRPRRVLLISDGNPFLEAALSSDASLQTSRIPPNGTVPKGKWDAVVVDGASGAKPPDGIPTLWMAATGSSAPITGQQPSTDSQVLETSATHPAAAALDLSNVRFARLLTGTPKSSATTIGFGASGSVLVAQESRGVRGLWCGFRGRLEEGGIALSPAFPILVSASLRWLTSGDDLPNGTVRTGTPITVRGVDPKPEAPKDVPVSTAKAAEGTLVTIGAPGFVRVGEAATHQLVGASLVSEQESDITPNRQKLPEGGPDRATGKRVTESVPLVPIVAVLVGIILSVEWWLFHRRPALVS